MTARCSRVSAQRANHFAETLFEKFDPAAEVEARSAGHQQMNMIRHDDIPADSDAVLAPSALDKGEECGVDVRLSQTRPTLMRAKGDEINRGVAIGVKDRW